MRDPRSGRRYCLGEAGESGFAADPRAPVPKFHGRFATQANQGTQNHATNAISYHISDEESISHATSKRSRPSDCEGRIRCLCDRWRGDRSWRRSGGAVARPQDGARGGRGFRFGEFHRFNQNGPWRRPVSPGSRQRCGPQSIPPGEARPPGTSDHVAQCAALDQASRVPYSLL